MPDPAGAPPGIQVRSARLTLGGHVLFDGLDLDLPSGSWTCLLGASGVGKTTILRIVAGVTSPEVPTRIETTDRGRLAGRFAWMGQQDLLFPWLTVLENVTIGARLRGEAPDNSRAMDLLARVGLADRATDRPAALSGGMRQRAALARTLAEDRPVILMDEPFSALDVPTRLRLQDMAMEMLRGRTVLMVTHDPLEALRLADQVLVLRGRPATLSAPLKPPGPAPRRADDPTLLRLQGELLRELSMEAEA